MWGGRRESFMILFWEKEREEEEREDRIKSAMRIKSFCHDSCVNSILVISQDL